MARINFEDDIESQDEFWKLIELVGGNRVLALGKLVLFFRIAQKAYGHDRPMTEAELRAKDMGDMIESGWAVPVEAGYQALGAAKHFGWYRQKVVAGKTGGRPLDNRPVSAANRTVPPANPPAPVLALVQKTKNKRPKARRREYPAEFEAIYRLYPKREKKADGFRIYEREILTDEDRDKLRQAIANYIQRKRGTDPKYLMQFSTFMDEWDEWLDPDHGSVAIPGKELKPRNLEAM